MPAIYSKLPAKHNHVLCVGAAGQLEKVFKAAVGFLEEGSLDARTYGKRIIWQVNNLPCIHGNACKRGGESTIESGNVVFAAGVQRNLINSMTCEGNVCKCSISHCDI